MDTIQITPDYVFSEFFKAQLASGKRGLIPSFSGFNDVFRNKLGIDPVGYTKSLEEKGLIRVAGKLSSNKTPYVVLTLTDKGYAHFNIEKLPDTRKSTVANKKVEGIWADLNAGKPLTILRKAQ